MKSKTVYKLTKQVLLAPISFIAGKVYEAIHRREQSNPVKYYYRKPEPPQTTIPEGYKPNPSAEEYNNFWAERISEITKN